MFHQERGAPPAAPVPKARAKDSGVPPPPPPAASSSLNRPTDTRSFFGSNYLPNMFRVLPNKSVFTTQSYLIFLETTVRVCEFGSRKVFVQLCIRSSEPVCSTTSPRAIRSPRPRVADQFSRVPSHDGDGAVPTAEPVRHGASTSEEPSGLLELLEEHSADSSFFAEEGLPQRTTLPHVPQPMSRTASENEDPPVPRQTALQFSLRAASQAQSAQSPSPSPSPAPIPQSLPSTPVRTPPSLGLEAGERLPAEEIGLGVSGI